MPSVNRVTNYRVLRQVGFTAESATKLKDYNNDTIRELVRCAREVNPDVKARFEEILGKSLRVQTVFKVG
jgi:hypothetical protein